MQFHAQLQDHHFFSVLSKGLFDSFPVNLADRDAGSVHQACFLLIHPGNIAVVHQVISVYFQEAFLYSDQFLFDFFHRCLCTVHAFQGMQQHGISAPADIGNVPIQHTAFIARRVDREVSRPGPRRLSTR